MWAQENEGKYSHPHAPDFLEYVKNKLVVTFKNLANPKEEGVSIEMSRTNTYDEVAQKLADKLGIADPEMLRFTQHNVYTQAPKPQALKFQQYATLLELLSQYNSIADTLYYEVLDLKLHELERLKILKVEAHGERAGSNVQVLTLRIAKEGSVDDVLKKLEEQVGAEYAGRTLRFMEILTNKIYKASSAQKATPASALHEVLAIKGSEVWFGLFWSRQIDQINDQYWTLRVEPVPDNEVNLDEQSRLLQVCHIQVNNGNNSTQEVAGVWQPQLFGDPFLIRLDDTDTLGGIKERIRQKLPKEVSDEDYGKYNFHIVNNLRPPQLLKDSDVLAALLPKNTNYANGSEPPYLGLEHADTLPRRPPPNPPRSQYERPVKIYN
eukprot:jgi/Botrbrau1/18465/Bobra.0072s0048.1